MLAIIEDLHAPKSLNSAKTADMEQIQGFLTQNNCERSEAVKALARLQEKLESLKLKSSIFNHITFSNHVAPMM